MTKILGLDTSTEACSVALYIDGQVSEIYEVCPRNHTKKILPMVDQLLGQANLKIEDLDSLAVTRGPGSFTGVRLGICVAQGLAYAANLPIVPISTLEVVAGQALLISDEFQSAVVALDARMNEIYFAAYTRDKLKLNLVIEEQVVAPENLAPVPQDLFEQKVVGLGHGFARFGEELLQKLELPLASVDEAALPRAGALVALAGQYFSKGETVTAETCLPIYLRNKVIQSNP